METVFLAIHRGGGCFLDLAGQEVERGGGGTRLKHTVTLVIIGQNWRDRVKGKVPEDIRCRKYSCVRLQLLTGLWEMENLKFSILQNRFCHRWILRDGQR